MYLVISAKKKRYVVMGSDYGEAASTLPSQL
jgi:hypothetical protein